MNFAPRTRIACALVASGLLIASSACGSTDSGNDDRAASSSSADPTPTEEPTPEDPYTEAPSETAAPAADLGPTVKHANVSVTHPGGYEAAVDITIHEMQALTEATAPDECADVAANYGDRAALRVVPIEVSTTDLSKDGFEWPEENTLGVTTKQGTMDFPDWRVCAPGPDRVYGMDVEWDTPTVVYAAIASRVTPNSPDGEFGDRDPMKLYISIGMGLGRYQLDGCPDQAENLQPCMVGPEVTS